MTLDSRSRFSIGVADARATASVLAACPEALGVYWGNATLLIPKDIFELPKRRDAASTIRFVNFFCLQLLASMIVMVRANSFARTSPQNLMNVPSSRTVLSAGAAFLFAAASTLQAATIPQDQSQSSPDANGWTVASIWNPNGAPIAGNDYINPLGFTLRTPEATSTFAGDSLTIRGTLGLKSAVSTSRTKTVNNLILDGGVIQNFTDGANFIQTLAGNVTVLSNSSVVVGNSLQVRHTVLSAAIGGSGNLSVSTLGGSGSRLEVTNAANTFSGFWNLNSGLLRFTLDGSVGNGDIRVSGGTLEIQHNWNNNGSLLDIDGGNITLGAFNWTVGALDLGGSSLAPDNYTVAELNSFGTGVFSGTGSITVVPEPTVVSMMICGLGILLSVPRRQSISREELSK